MDESSQLLIRVRELVHVAPLTLQSSVWPLVNKVRATVKEALRSSDAAAPLIDFLAVSLLEETALSALLTLCGSFMQLLVVRLCDFDPNPSREWVRATTIALAHVLQSSPHVLNLVEAYCKSTRFAFGDFNTPNASSVDESQFLSLARAGFYLLKANKETFSSMWDWAPFLSLLTSRHLMTRYYCACAVALLLGLSDFEAKLFFRCFRALPPMETSLPELHHPLTFSLTIENEETHPTYRLEWHPVLEHADALLQEEMRKAQRWAGLSEHIVPPPSATTASAPNLVTVAGIAFPKRVTHMDVAHTNMVMVASAENNLRACMLALCQASPVLLEGPPGCGKTVMIEELMYRTGNIDAVRIHLDDQIDSKTLLGTYVCTDVPGQFVWRAGALTRAMQEGRWVIFEDIDRGSFEVLSGLIPLFEQRRLFLPGRGDMIQCAPGCQIIATRTSALSKLKGSTDLSPILRSHFSRVLLQPLTDQELRNIIQLKYPMLTNWLDLLLSTFYIFAPASSPSALPSSITSSNNNQAQPKPAISQPVSTRIYSTRDLFLFCQRLVPLFQFQSGDMGASLREDVLVTATDCFVSFVPKREHRATLTRSIADVWGVSRERSEFFLASYKPRVEVFPTSVAVGRVTLPRDAAASKLLLANTTFALTKHSLCLMERIATSVALLQPVLLVGETGNGKTAIVQHLAHQMGQKLIVQNLNQQTDSSDFLGGFKPVDLRTLCLPLMNKFGDLFPKTLSRANNEKFILQVKKSFAAKNWPLLIRLLTQCLAAVKKQLDQSTPMDDSPSDAGSSEAALLGKRKSSAVGLEEARKVPKAQGGSSPQQLVVAWEAFARQLTSFEKQVVQCCTSFAFWFAEGSLVRALREGHWILLDEINLAAPETLERLSSVLESTQGSLSLTERGDAEIIERHHNFRLFSCMNPPTDFGKRNLPPALRGRFCEMYVDDIEDKEDLEIIIQQFLDKSLFTKTGSIENIVELYLQARVLANTRLLDGANHHPVYSIRSLCRALAYTKFCTPVYGFARALYEGFWMSFCTMLIDESRTLMENLILKLLTTNNSKGITNKIPASPGDEYLLIESFWIQRGPLELKQNSRYIITQTVQQRLKHLARVIVARKHPILLQGPTSAGKTSLVEHLALITGHKFVRINNHEHTDIQEYMGSYVSDSQGRLVFQEGALVTAVREGAWIVLDELNLAPSEVLEALNRLLDDNRELFIPETQEVVQPHPSFLLFATQNPPGVYGGRKVLSRAFRNRFVELHVDDIPESELTTILELRCKIPPSYCTCMINTLKELQLRRNHTSVFAGKKSFITPRDLFRWGDRQPQGYKALAEEGYMLLGERIRIDEEKAVVREVLERTCKHKIDTEELYGMSSVQQYVEAINAGEASGKISWTAGMRRLFTLVRRCAQYSEPVLLVGETGCGKTTVCQVLSLLLNQPLRIINCHQHTETADFIGGLRPVRGKERLLANLREGLLTFFDAAKVAFPDILNHPVIHAFGHDPSMDIDKIMVVFMELLRRFDQTPVSAELNTKRQEVEELHRRYQSLFEWYDGTLVQAMRNGDLQLIDEISLADDAVLERLNSVFEPGRTLFLAEKGGQDVDTIVAHDNFRVFATMNPGGDFGKKELSPALRNRFTEIWVPALTAESDILAILNDRGARGFGEMLLQFVIWFNALSHNRRLSLRDILSWADFMNQCADVSAVDAYVHGACLVVLDGLGIGTGASELQIQQLHAKCVAQLISQIPENDRERITRTIDDPSVPIDEVTMHVHEPEGFGIAPFFIKRGPVPAANVHYALHAKTTKRNLLRVLRAMQLKKAVLLEGSPGVGKTSLLTALAAASGHRLARINLSEQTDMMDLLGMDLPVHGGKGGEFAWCDGVFLQALKAGDWVLLDELNLASQSVLEGLNAVLDHRAQVYIPELNRTFDCAPGFRVFACQNPMSQGGGRKGLPVSFLNRFTKVHLSPLDSEDLSFITRELYPDIPPPTLNKMIDFNATVYEETMVKRLYGQLGTPWEFNLRDIFRWCDLIRYRTAPRECIETIPGPNDVSQYLASPGAYLDLVYLQRMRTNADRGQLLRTYARIFESPDALREVDSYPTFHITDTVLQVGHSFLPRSTATLEQPKTLRLEMLHEHLRPLQHLMKCVERRWPAVVVGPSCSGKTSLIRLLAQVVGQPLHEFAMTSSSDSTDLLGCFEQMDLPRHRHALIVETGNLTRATVNQALLINMVEQDTVPSKVQPLLTMWDTLSKLPEENALTVVQTLLDACTAVLQGLPPSPTIKVAAQLSTKLRELQSLEQGAAGKFEWIDGALLTALEEGHWVLLDNVNFCNPTVLDRLNPLLEEKGVLLVNECGLINGEPRVITPHPNFRLFLAMDPHFGDISRAMRNRCVEIVLTNGIGDKAFAEYRSPLEKYPAEIKQGEMISFDNAQIEMRDVLLLLRTNGIPGQALPTFMTSVHSELLRWAIKNRVISIRSSSLFTARHLIHWATLTVQQVARATDKTLIDLLARSFLHAYTPQTLLGSEVSAQFMETIFTPLFIHFLQTPSLPLLPSLWPTISASLHPLEGVNVQSTEMLRIRMDAAVPEYVLRAPKAQLATARTPLTPAGVLSNSMLEVALLAFGEGASPADWQTRAVGLRALCGGVEEGNEQRALLLVRASHIFFTSCPPVVQKYFTLRDEISAHCAFSLAYMRSQALDLRRNSALLDLLADDIKTHLLSLSDRAVLVFGRLLRTLAEKEIMSRVPKQIFQSLGVLEQSLACHLRLLDAERLAHPLVLGLWPFFIAFDDFVLKFLEFSSHPALPELFVRRDLFWTSLCQPRFDASEVCIRWALVHKQLLLLKEALVGAPTDVLSAFELAVNISRNAEQDLAQGGVYVGSKSLLWKRGGRPLLARTGQVQQIESQLAALDSRLLIDPKQTTPIHPWFCVTSEWKRTFVEAMCNLRFLCAEPQKSQGKANSTTIVNRSTDNSAFEDRSRLLRALVSVPESLEQKLEGLIKEEQETLKKGHFLVPLLSASSESLSDLGMNDLAEQAESYEMQEASLARVKDDEFAPPSFLVSLDFEPDRRTVQPDLFGVYDLHAIELSFGALALCQQTVVLLSTLAENSSRESSSVTLMELNECCGQLIPILRRCYDFGLQESSATPRTFVAPLQLRWIIESVQSLIAQAITNESLGEIQRLTTQIVSHMQDFAFHTHFLVWNNGCTPWAERAQLSLGPALLYTAAPSCMVLALVASVGSSLSERRIKKVQYQRLLNHFVNEEIHSDSKELKLILNSIANTLNCFLSSFEPTDMIEIREFLHNVVSSSIPEAALRRSKDPRFLELLEPVVLPLFGLVKDTNINELVRMGQIWIFLGLWRFHALVPSSAVDPSFKYRLQTEFQSDIVTQHNTDQVVRQWMHAVNSGSKDIPSDRLHVLTQAKEDQNRISNKLTFRDPSAKPFLMLYQSIVRFTTSAAQITKVTTLMKRLCEQKQQSLAEEELWQHNAECFTQSMLSDFSAYPDFTQPLLVALYEMRHGLRLLAHSSSYNEDEVDTKALNSFLSFPSGVTDGQYEEELSCLTPLETLTEPEVLARLDNWFKQSDSSTEKTGTRPPKKSASVRVQTLHTILQRVSLMAQTSSSSHLVSKRMIALTRSLFATYVDAWIVHNETVKAQEAKEAEMYKFKERASDIKTDQEREDEAMKLMYPEFEKDFEEPDPDMVTAVVPEATKEDSKFKKAAPALTDKEMQDLVEVYCSVYGSVTTEKAVDDEKRLRSFWTSYSLASSLVKARSSALSPALDRQAVFSHIFALAASANQLGSSHMSTATTTALLSTFSAESVVITPANNKIWTSSRSDKNKKDTIIPDVWSEANVGEVKLVEEPILAVMIRLRQLLTEFPEHPILMQLISLANKITRLPTTCPLMKVLTGLELLLKKGEEWQAYASKRVSLSTVLKPLSCLVARWRKMELHSWPRALLNAEHKVRLRALRWWFHLYNLVNCSNAAMATFAPPESSQEEIEKAYLHQLFTSLEELMQKSPLGELWARIDLLRGFESQLRCEVIISPSSLKLHLANSIHNLCNYYSQYLPASAQMLQTLRAPLEKSLKEQVKLCCWDLSNYWSLKQSSEKSHRKLHRLCVQWEEHLQTTFLSVVTSVTDADAKSTSDLIDFSPLSAATIAANNKSTEEGEGDNKTKDSKKNKNSKKRKEADNQTETVETQQKISRLAAPLISEPLKEMVSSSIQVTHLYNKMQNLLTKSLYAPSIRELATESVSLLDDLAVSIITRCTELAQPNTKFAYKKKAFADYSKSIREMGLSPHSAALNSVRVNGRPIRTHTHTEGSREMPDAFVQSPLSTAFKFGRARTFLPAAERCEGYVNRVMSTMNKLRLRMSSCHKDLSRSEAAKACGSVEHLFAFNVALRDTIGSTASQYLCLAHWLALVREERTQNSALYCAPSSTATITATTTTSLSSCPSCPSGDNSNSSNSSHETLDVSHWLWVQKDLVDSLLEVGKTTVLFYEKVLACAEEKAQLRAGLAHITSMMTAVEKSKRDLVEVMESIHPPFPSSAGISWLSISPLSAAQFISSLFSSLLNIFRPSIYLCPPGLAALKKQLETSSARYESLYQSNSSLYLSSSDLPLEAPKPFQDLIAKIFESLQLPIQNVYKVNNITPTSEVTTTTNSKKSTPLLDGFTKHLQQLQDLRVDRINNALANASEYISRHVSDIPMKLLCVKQLRQFEPLLELLLQVTEDILSSGLEMCHGGLKLNFVLATVLCTITSKGFCRKPDEKDEDEKEQDDCEGTGMGEGEGKKDVSNEIEDEEQLTGTKDEKKAEKDENDEKQEQNPDEGLEMKQEFDGDMHDVPPEEQDEKNDKDKDEEEEEELDREMGDLGDAEEKNIVDEKLWESDEENQIDREEEKYEENEMDSKQQETEQKAKDNGEEDEEDNKKDKDKDKSKDDKEEEEEEGKGEKGSDDEEEEEQDDDTAEKEGPINRDDEDRIEETPMDPSEIPDELDLGKEEEEEDNENGEEEEGGGEENNENENNNSDDDINMEDVKENKEENEEEEEEGKGKDEDEQPMEDNEENKEEEEEKVEDSADQTNVEAPPVQEEHTKPENEEEEGEANRPESKDQKASEQAVMQQGGESEAKESEEEEQQSENRAEQSKAKEGETEGQDSEFAPSKQDSKQKPKKQQRQKPEVNPYKSLAEAPEKWLERMQIEKHEDVDMEEKDTEHDDNAADEISAAQHVKEEDKADTSALAPTDDAQEKPPPPPPMKADEKDKEKEEDEEEDKKKEKVESKQEKEEKQLNKENEKRTGKKSLWGTEEEKEVNQEEQQPGEEEDDDDLEGKREDEELRSIIAPPLTGAQDMVNQMVEFETEIESKSEEYTSLEAVEVWENLKFATNALCHELCEHLRIILEPMLATALKGDYRTGKRVNIKKIIPYLASQFRKDKIWLRRTKPNKRNYQVMVAIDDSLSMKENGSGNLALQALATLSRAMAQLEVGELSIMSFGEHVRLLHGFEEPFNDEAGAHAVSQFHFEQTKTLWVPFLNAVAKTLTEAKLRHSGSEDQYQLVFIISDGVLNQTRDEIANLVREALNQGQLLVLMIVDSPADSRSVLKRQSVSYPGGKMQLKAYLEDFPFPYYVVLRDIASLPEIVSDALTQWFELIQKM